jgi:hypothetical protein
MGSHTSNGEPANGAGFDPLIRRTVLLDLEVSPQGKLLKIGAILGERARVRSGRFPIDEALESLSLLARAADAGSANLDRLRSHGRSTFTAKHPRRLVGVRPGSCP